MLWRRDKLCHRLAQRRPASTPPLAVLFFLALLSSPRNLLPRFPKNRAKLSQLQKFSSSNFADWLKFPHFLKRMSKQFSSTTQLACFCLHSPRPYICPEGEKSRFSAGAASPTRCFQPGDGSFLNMVAFPSLTKYEKLDLIIMKICDSLQYPFSSFVNIIVHLFF